VKERFSRRRFVTNSPTYGEREIACAQVLQKESAVRSVQWTVIPAGLAEGITPASLLDRYLGHIRHFTLGVVVPVQAEEGIEFRLFRIGPPLLRFERGNAGADHLALTISGGLLLHPKGCAQGELTFSCEAVPGGIRVVLNLSDYCPLLLGEAPPRWRKALYRFTQAAIHKVVTVRFLVRLHRELAGKRICCRVVKMREIEGEEI
jgi:hypothetical protein